MKIAPFMFAAMLTSASLTMTAHAGEINVAWDPTPGATAYRVYFGTTPGVYSASITTSSASATISGLQDCTPHYVAVKALNGAGESAQYSNEVTGWPRPLITSATPVSAMQGRQAVLDLVGSNFQPGATIDVGDENILLGSVSVLSCTHIQVLTTVEPTAANVRPAQIGRRDVTVTNPDDVYGLRAQGFEVLINPARFDINRSDAATTNRIDGKDTVYLSRLFSVSEPSPSYDPDYDFDGNGWIDGTDLSYIAANTGKCWSSATGTWTSGACPTNLR